MGTTSRSVLATLAVLLAVLLLSAAWAALGAVSAQAAGGSIDWTRTSDPTTSGDLLYRCASPSGALYAAGTAGASTAADAWVVKYKAGGAKAWSRVWAGPDGRAETVSAFAVDKAGSVYVAGGTTRGSDRWDSLLLKYDAAGHLIWKVTYPAALVNDDLARGVGLDAAGNVYVAGDADRTTSDLYVARFDPVTGARQWTCWYDSTHSDGGGWLAVTGAGVCYVAGTTGNTDPTTYALLFKVNADGTPGWARTWNDATAPEAWQSVALGRSGDVVVSGRSSGAQGVDVAVARYSSLGGLRWAGTWSSSGASSDWTASLAVTRHGGIWVGCDTYRGTSGYRSAALKWSWSGKLQFAKVLGSAKRQALVNGLVVDGQGNCYCAGAIGATGGGDDLLAVKYAPGGARKWISTRRFAGNSFDSLESICLGPAGSLYACGGVDEQGTNGRGVLVRLRR